MDHKKGISANFVHLHNDRWFVYQKLPNGNFLTPKAETRIYGREFKEDSYFSNSPLLDIAYNYTRRAIALAKAKELYEAGMFNPI